MRITNQVLFNQALGNTQQILARIERQQSMISSGLRVERPSDDPAAVGQIMRSSSSLRALDQYQENLSGAQSRLAVESTTLDQLSNVLIRAKEVALSQGGATASTESRAAAQTEVEGLREYVIELGNAQFLGSYIYGGVYADSRPLTTTGIDPTRPPTGDHQVEGGAGVFYSANHNGQEIFVDTGVLDTLEDLALALGSDSPTDIQASIGGLDSSFDGVQQLTAELGVRMNHVDTAMENLSALDVTLQTLRADLQEADIEESVTALVAAQVTYQAAMMANSRILTLTLTDYLR